MRSRTMSTRGPSRCYDAKYFENPHPQQFAKDFMDIHTRIGDIEDALNTCIDDLQREFLEERASNAEFQSLTKERLAENDRKVQETYACIEQSWLRATTQCAEDRGGSSFQHQSRGDRERSRSHD
ncbi:hypothetical protein HK104_010659 [Borealophlyctis nickersoniae]|nr:hypothetical protein HK104_010659 [Borealophlyctis nickersoniae]